MYFSVFFFSSRRRHTRCSRDWSSDVCSSDLKALATGDRALESSDVACAPHAPRVTGYRWPLPPRANLRVKADPAAPLLLDSHVRMCGIVGIVHSDPARPVPPAVIRRMCEAIRHRGPDDEGAYVDRSVGLGMRRLSIIDLAGGRQPIFNEDQSKGIVFNGEIYNYRELPRGLIAH